MIDRIDELKRSVRRRKVEGERVGGAPHYYYLEGFFAALDEPFEVREAKARLHFYQNVPITIRPGEAIVGRIDWNEPLVCTIANTRLRQDLLAQIRSSDLPEAEKARIGELAEAVRPFCFDP